MSCAKRAVFRCNDGAACQHDAAGRCAANKRVRAVWQGPRASGGLPSSLAVALLAGLIVLAGLSANAAAFGQEQKEAAKQQEPPAKPQKPTAKEPAAKEAAAAEEQPPPAPGQKAELTAPPRQSFIQWLITASGFFFFPQLFISIALIALVVTNLLAVRRRNFIAAEFISQFETLVKERKFSEAFELARQEVSMVGRLIAAGLQRLTAGHSEAVRAMQETGEEENMKYEHRLSYLALIGNVATLVGLLGTVWGMVTAFMVIGQSDVAPKPSELARGVSQALVTTVMGLIQAIPAIIFFTILRNRTAALVLEVGIVGERLMQNFKGVVARRPSEAGSSTSLSSKSSTTRPASQTSAARPSGAESGSSTSGKKPDESG